ncbi:MAG TPA: plastocyanin/azurin family copper-binding protein [Actinomycetota bacterium]
MRRRIGLIIAAAAISLLAAAPGHTVGQAAGPAAEITGFTLPEMVVPQGQAATFANLDPLAPHDVTSVARVGGATSARRFESATIGFGETADIARVSGLASGDYEYFCKVHPTTMRGVLHVV